jgi:hypothetical protein
MNNSNKTFGLATESPCKQQSELVETMNIFDKVISELEIINKTLSERLIVVCREAHGLQECDVVETPKPQEPPAPIIQQLNLYMDRLTKISNNLRGVNRLLVL